MINILYPTNKKKQIHFFAVSLFFTCCFFKAQSLKLIPYPNEVIFSKTEKPFLVNSEIKIVYSKENLNEAQHLQKHLSKILSAKIPLVKLAPKNKAVIALTYQKGMQKEAYELNISKHKILIKASKPEGWFYGVQTLIQLIDTHPLKNKKITLASLTIKDNPRFSWRAFMLDEARHFKGKKHVKSLLDEMAYLKMNTFHWHLTDDAGWRIEIKKYPKLTSVGAYRKSTRVSNGKRWDSKIESGTPHGGFYTHEDIKEIIAYAKKRHINIVPEIEMPGHASAAIAAYPWLSVANKQIEVPTRFGVFYDVYNVASPKVYHFIVDVLNEVMALFPSPVIHIGGDEIKYKQWKESKEVQAYMKKNNISSPADLHVFFTNRIAKNITKKGRRMMGWNDIMGKNLHHYQDETENATGEVELSKNTVVHFWKGDIKLMTAAAREGFELVNSVHTHTYLDYDYGYTPITKSYNFNPIPKDLEPKYHSKIIGTGCQMWSEWLPTIGELHYQVFPRIAAYAAVGWERADNRNYERFEIALKPILDRWKNKGIYYAPLEIAKGKKKK